MTPRYDRLVPTLKNLLASETLGVIGRVVSFIKRLREIEAGTFVWAVVLSRFGHGRPGFEQARDWYTRLSDSELWPRPFQMRFKSASAVDLFEKAFDQAVQNWRDSSKRNVRHWLARQFADIVACDSTLVQVHDSLSGVYWGTRMAPASIKVALAVSLFGLLPLFAQVVPGFRHDMSLFPPLESFRASTLLLFDKGFLSYERLRDIAKQSLFYLCPMKQKHNGLIVAVHRAPAYVRKMLKKNPDGVPLRRLLPDYKRIGSSWDLEVLVKPLNHPVVRTRLIILPGPTGEQRPYLTNLDATQWNPTAIRELYRLRWQAELVIKELKQHVNLESMPSRDRHAVKVFAWASLIALVLSRTVSGWLFPLGRIVGLSSQLRPMLTTRSLRATVSLLGYALVTPPRKAREFIRLLAYDVLGESRSSETHRVDSFKRLLPLLAA